MLFEVLVDYYYKFIDLPTGCNISFSYKFYIPNRNWFILTIFTDLFVSEMVMSLTSSSYVFDSFAFVL